MSAKIHELHPQKQQHPSLTDHAAWPKIDKHVALWKSKFLVHKKVGIRQGFIKTLKDGDSFVIDNVTEMHMWILAISQAGHKACRRKIGEYGPWRIWKFDKF